MAYTAPYASLTAGQKMKVNAALRSYRSGVNPEKQRGKYVSPFSKLTSQQQAKVTGVLKAAGHPLVKGAVKANGGNHSGGGHGRADDYKRDQEGKFA